MHTFRKLPTINPTARTTIDARGSSGASNSGPQDARGGARHGAAGGVVGVRLPVGIERQPPEDPRADEVLEPPRRLAEPRAVRRDRLVQLLDVDPDLQGALDIYLDVQKKKGLDAATENVWALLNAFCHPDDAFARSYPRDSVELSIERHRAYSNPFERGGEIPADYKAYSDWFEKHDKQSYEQVLNSHLTLMGDPDRIIGKMKTVIDMGWRNIMLRMSRGGACRAIRMRRVDEDHGYGGGRVHRVAPFAAAARTGR